VIFAVEIQSNTSILILLQFIEDTLSWLNEWELHVGQLSGDLKKQCLSPSTFQGMRVTLLSTLQLSQALFESENREFRYVLTSRFGQDPLEVLWSFLKYHALILLNKAANASK